LKRNIKPKDMQEAFRACGVESKSQTARVLKSKWGHWVSNHRFNYYEAGRRLAQNWNRHPEAKDLSREEVTLAQWKDIFETTNDELVLSALMKRAFGVSASAEYPVGDVHVEVMKRSADLWREYGEYDSDAHRKTFTLKIIPKLNELDSLTTAYVCN